MKLIGYAMDFASFLIQNLKNTDKINSIILFGSVARNDEDKESDIDLFINTLNEKNLEKEIKKIKEKFFDSLIFKNYWKLLGIKNEINIIVGDIEKWKLKDSMLGNSIILYQKYLPKLEDGENITIFAWKNIKPNSKRVLLSKKIFGYNYYGKFYNGMLQKYNGKLLGSGVISIPTEHANLFIKLFRTFKINVKIIKVFKYSE